MYNPHFTLTFEVCLVLKLDLDSVIDEKILAFDQNAYIVSNKLLRWSCKTSHIDCITC